MPKADYKCPRCERVFELEFDSLPDTVERSHETSVNRKMGCFNTELKRVWGPVAIGRVKGAGGSPPRV